MSGFMKLGGMLLVSTDPLEESLVRVVEEVGGYNHKDPKILAFMYQNLARISLPDWPVIRDDLSTAASTGYSALYHCMQGMLRVYQLQNARTINSSLSVFSQLLDQVQTTSRQMEMNKSLQQNLTRQLDTFGKSLTVYTENLDNKIRELSISKPTATVVMTPHTQRTESGNSHQRDIPCKLSLIPNTTFKSKYAVVFVYCNGKITLNPVTAQGAQLSAINQLAISGKVKLSILNLDLDQILSVLTMVPDLPQRFNSLTTLPEKLQLLNRTFSGIPENPTQWVRSITWQSPDTGPLNTLGP